MLKISKKTFLLFFIFVLSFGLAKFARAVTPTLSVSSTGSGDSMQINVAGDPNSSVLLFAGNQTPVLGSTDSSGNFSTIISSGTYSIAPNMAVYVKTGGINGTMSNQVTWPYFQNTSTTSTLTLSQTALLLSAGQTSTITASANSLYLLSNSQPSIANINFNSNQITVQALTYGSTVANICAVGSTTNCANITVTVQNSSAQQLSFSQNNFSIVAGQSIAVTVSGGSGVYTISNNSNSSAIQTSLNGATVTLTAQNTTGTDSITVCTTDMTDCGIINVSATSVNSTSISFSQTNPAVAIGQSATVTIYGGNGSNFYVSSNSNPSIVQANITANILTLIANASTGSSAINICAYGGTCASLTANVGNASTGGAPTLSQTSISILAGQSSNITISGGSTPYSFSAPNAANIFNGDINGNVLTIYGVNAGSSSANICSSTGCTTLSVTITSLNSTTNPPTFSQNNILLNVGQQNTIYVSGTGNYYVSNNSSPTVSSVSINGNSVLITGESAGNSSIAICQSSGQCATLYVTVSAPQSVVAPVQTPVATTTTPAYVFPRYLGFGDKGNDVLALQQFLLQQGFLSATPNGHFGAATQLAVKKFQGMHSIRQTGNVGPSTLKLLNQLEAGSSSTTAPATNQTQINQIQQEIQQLESQLSAL